MFTVTPTRHLATLAAVAGLLVAAAPAGARTAQPPKSICPMPDVCATSTQGFWLGSNDALGVLYNGHAGVGAN